MNWEAIGAIGDLVGGIAVLATLVYLAIQVQQNTNSVRGAAEMESGRMRMDWHAIAASDPHLAEIWEKAMQNSQSLSWQELGRFRWFVASYFFVFEASWFQYKRRLLDDSGWIPLERAMLGLLAYQSVSEWWDAESSPYSSAFRQYVTDLRESGVKSDWSYQPTMDVHEKGRDL